MYVRIRIFVIFVFTKIFFFFGSTLGDCVKREQQLQQILF